MTDKNLETKLRLFGQEMADRLATAQMVFGPSVVDALIDEVTRLDADNARLRGLMRRAEHVECRCMSSQETGCPWCSKGGFYFDRNATPPKRFGDGHDADCPAFTPDGEVR